MFVCVLTHDSTARSQHVLYKQSAISEGKLDSNRNPGSLIKSYNHNLYIKRNFEMSFFQKYMKLFNWPITFQAGSRWLPYHNFLIFSNFKKLRPGHYRSILVLFECKVSLIFIIIWPRHFKLNTPSIIGRVSHRVAPGGPAIRDVYSLSHSKTHFFCVTKKTRITPTQNSIYSLSNHISFIKIEHTYVLIWSSWKWVVLIFGKF